MPKKKKAVKLSTVAKKTKPKIHRLKKKVAQNRARRSLLTKWS